MSLVPPATPGLHGKELPAHHPLRRVNRALKVWLVILTIMLSWNATIGAAIAIDGWARPLPWIGLAVGAVVWLFNSWSARATIWCSSFIAVGLWLRALELFLFGRDTYETRAIMTAASVWIFVGGTTIVFGFLNLVVISRRMADIEVWGHK